MLVRYLTVNPPVKGHWSRADDGLTKLVMLKVALVKELIAVPIFMVSTELAKEHEVMVIDIDWLVVQTGVPLIETPAGKVISYFELL